MLTLPGCLAVFCGTASWHEVLVVNLHQSCPQSANLQVGDIASNYHSDVGALVDELLPLLRRDLEAASEQRHGAVEAAAGLRDHGSVLRGLLNYSESIAHAVPSREMAVAEFKWRNGALLRLGSTQLHRLWLQRADVDSLMLAHMEF